MSSKTSYACFLIPDAKKSCEMSLLLGVYTRQTGLPRDKSWQATGCQAGSLPKSNKEAHCHIPFAEVFLVPS